MHCFRHQGGFERNGEVLDGPMWEMMRTLVEYVCAHWREPDRGIWEVRGSLHFKQRGSFWPFICSCSCSCPSSCSPWHGFVTFMCSIMAFPTQERGTPWSTVSGTTPYPPRDCPACRLSSTFSALVGPSPLPVRPWHEVKSRRGAPKRRDTQGFTCPNHQCPSFGITDAHVHALLWGWHPWSR
jgi:hypothetical protein